MGPKALTRPRAAETECVSCARSRSLLTPTTTFSSLCARASGTSAGLLSDVTAALDYDIAAEVLDNLDAEIDPEDLEDAGSV